MKNILKVVAVAAVALMPETVTRRRGVLASMRPRIRVPRPARRTFAAALPCLIAVWALGGLYLSLGPEKCQSTRTIISRVYEA